MLKWGEHEKSFTRACSRWGAIANPHAKVFDSPSTPQSHPGAWPWQQNENSVQYVFLSFICENTHKVWYKIFEIDMLMIFDLLTSPQSHQFDPQMKMLLAFCSARYPRRLDMLHDHVWIFFLPPGHPQRPKVPPLGHDPGNRMKIQCDMFCISLLWEHTQSLV